MTRVVRLPALDIVTASAPEAFALQEALRYRAALVEVERAAGSLAREMASDLAADALMRVARGATVALDAGEDAAQ